MKRRGATGSFEKLEGILRDPETYALAELIPDKARAGRPRHYPTYMWIVYLALVSAWQSARQVEAELAHPEVWGFMRRIAREVFPEDPSLWLPGAPMRRHHYRHARRYLKDPTILEEMQRVHREHAVALAREIGLLDPDGPGSFTHPALDRMLHGDGTVLSSVFTAKPDETRVDKETGEVLPVRHDPDASLHVEGDGTFEWGTKFVIVATRSVEDRVILDTAHVAAGTPGGEAAVAMACFERIAPMAPGVQGFVYDMAVRGKHIDRAMQLGMLAVTKVVAAESHSRGKNKRTGPWREKERLIETKRIKRAEGTEILLPIYARSGAPGFARLTETGDSEFVPFERIRTSLRPRKRGGFAGYNQYLLPQEFGGGELTLRLHGNDEDKKRGLNRAENLRAIPPSDPDFKRLFARRNDAESINRGLKDTMYLGRAHSVGHLGQEADLLGFALMTNALTRARHRARERLRAAA